MAKRKKAYQEIDLEKAVVILQPFDNSVKVVRGPGGIKQLTARDSAGHYHTDRPLLLADKAGVKDLTVKLRPMIKACQLQ